MKKIFISLVMIISGIFVTTPVFAEKCTCADGSEGVATSIIGNGCSCDDGSGSSITDILNLVVDIMSIGVGILGVIGITVVGIQYLTAGGSEEKVKKSKRRMFEIVIGIVVYVLLYAGLKWLLPSFGL